MPSIVKIPASLGVVDVEVEVEVDVEVEVEVVPEFGPLLIGVTDPERDCGVVTRI
jgi:hypothetical protein